MSLLDK